MRKSSRSKSALGTDSETTRGRSRSRGPKSQAAAASVTSAEKEEQIVIPLQPPQQPQGQGQLVPYVAQEVPAQPEVEGAPYGAPTVGRFGGAQWLLSLTLTAAFLVFNVLCLCWILSAIFGPLDGVYKYVSTTLSAVLDWIRKGGPAAGGYSCLSSTMEEDVLCQIKAGLHKWYKTLFLAHLLKYVASIFDTANFFNCCASAWVVYSAARGILYRVLSFLSTRIQELARPTFKFLAWYSQLVFVNTENAVHTLLVVRHRG